MELGRKFSVGSAGIYAWHEQPPTRPPPPPPPPRPSKPPPPPPSPINSTRPSFMEEAAAVVPSVHASLGPVSSPPLLQPQPPPQPRRAPPPPSSTAVGIGVGIGFGLGAVIFLVIVFMWSLRRKINFFAGLCQEASPEKSRDDQLDYPHQPLQQSGPSQVHNMVCRPPTTVCSLNTPPSSKKHYSTSTTISGSQKPFSHALSGLGLKLSKRMFTFEELTLATDGFSDNNILGQGGFGYVHKGILSNGQEVAVKQLKIGSAQGEREFQSEVDTVSHLHHKNLVSLVGYCSTGDERVLVYDCVPNKTLEFHLHGKSGEPLPSNWAPLNWATRMKVALGSAKGLAYLHEDCQPMIIHRDIKASNILLDDNFEAKVSDFGLARFTNDTDTYISTRVIGTFGYIAPEYAQTGKLTIKSDVYSFGVMLLELITGRRPIAKETGVLCKENHIVDWARPLLAQAIRDANFDTLVDERLEKNYDFTGMSRMVTCAEACVRHLARLRPRMSEIVQVLEGKISLDVLKENETICGVASSDFEGIEYTEKFKKLLFDNLESSSECSGLNSDFIRCPSASSSECLRAQPYLESSEGNKIETNQKDVIRDGKDKIVEIF